MTKRWKVCTSCGGDLEAAPLGSSSENRCLSPNSHHRPDGEHIWLWIDNKFVLRSYNEKEVS